MLKCPVCKNDYTETDNSCPNCGFTDIHREFLNKDDLYHWMEETVYPCQAVYQTMATKYAIIAAKYGTLEKSTSSISQNEICGDRDSCISFSKSFTAKSNQTTCEIDNVKFDRPIDEDGEQGEAWFDFLAKKISDIDGPKGTNTIGFRCKVKNNRGVIICNEKWFELGLRVGDVVEGHLCLGYIPDDLTGWSAEFESEDYL